MDCIEFKNKKYPLTTERMKFKTVEEFRGYRQQVIDGKLKGSIERKFFEFTKEHLAPTFNVDIDELYNDEVEELIVKILGAFREVSTRNSAFYEKVKPTKEISKDEIKKAKLKNE